MRRARALATAAATALAGPAWAQSDNPFGGFRHDSDAPIEITADALEVSEAESRATFTGDVVAGQGALRLSAERLLVWYGGGGGGEEGPGGDIDRLRAEGGVFLSSGEEAAEGEWAEYDVPAGTMTMGGGVILTQGDNAIQGERLTIDLNAGTGRMEGGRVRSVFSPARD